jgi:hypothetical protein
MGEGKPPRAAAPTGRQTKGRQHKWYNYNDPAFLSGFTKNCGEPPNKKVNGHFTQTVWKDTREIVCGRATCKMTVTLNQGNPNERTITTDGTHRVCRYNPAGNIDTGDKANLRNEVHAPTCH